MTDSTKMASIGVGVVSACGVVAVVVYKLLIQFNITNKKIDPRRITSYAYLFSRDMTQDR
jgi:hypothetical protein